MNPLVLDEIVDVDAYEPLRDAYRARVQEAKRARRIGVGDRVTLVFENRETVRFQVQEMMRIERIRAPEKVQHELEGKFFAEQEENEKAALALYATSPALARKYLTEYCVTQGDMVTARWRKLGEFLIWKYLDGNVRDEKGNVTHPPLPEAWYRAVAQEGGELLRVPKPAPTPTPAPTPAP